MKKKARTKKELIEDPADLRQQPADMKKPSSETKTSLQALQASEIRYRRLFETARDGILILDAETGQIVDVNPYMVDMLHYSHEEFMGKRLWEVSPFKDTVVNQAAFEELQSKGYIRYKDLPLQTKEGKPVAVEFVSNAYQANGDKVIQCNIRNINERKQIDQKLQEAVIFQQRLIDALPIPIFYLDAEGKYLGCNNSFEKFFGQKREHMTGKSLYELFPKEIADLYYEKNLALLQNPGIQIYETVVKDGDGVVHNVIFHKATFPNSDGSVGGLIGGILDITDRKEAEEALRESERQYHEFFTTSRDCVFITSVEGKWIDFNGVSLEMFGYDSREELSQVPISSLYVNQEVRHKLTALIQTLGYVNEHPAQLRRKDGAVIDTLITVGLRRNVNGFATGYYGTIHDITKRKQAEEALRVSEENYRNLFENAGEAIYVVQDGKLVFFNSMATMMIGYSAEELMSRSFIEFIHPDDRDMVIDRYARRMKGEELAHIYPFRIIHRDGRVMWVELNAVLINWRGKPATLNFMSDITERKRTEEESKQSFERMRKALKATVHSISMVVEMKDPYTSGHQKRVADLARSIAKEMGLSADRQDFVRMSATIHDIGKIAIPSEILSKPTKLTDLEFSLIKTHAQSGYDILKDIEFPWPVADVVFQHHERMDGSGYPQGLKGNDILLEARILAVADVVESMSSYRPYRPSLGTDAALEEISNHRGTLYDNIVADACLKLFREKGYQLPA